MNVLVTGGAGYIGSHAALRLLGDGHAVTILDDLSRGNRGAVETVLPLGDAVFVEGDIADRACVEALLRERSINTVMHFAGLTYVGESVKVPLDYYRVNAAGSMSLLAAMGACGVRRMVFSSTCATYGEPPPANIPITESCPQQPVNPYGHTKLLIEQMLRDYGQADDGFASVALRYFNVAGCDAGGRLGEAHDPETHLVPICLQAALGQRPEVTIFGTDYDTPDGTCIRDYVHVDDLIEAHVMAMDALRPGMAAWNVGIGTGVSVREVVESARRVTGVDFAVAEGDRRAGDPPILYADPSRIRADLGWSAKHADLDEIVATAWAWFRANPAGYASV